MSRNPWRHTRVVGSDRLIHIRTQSAWPGVGGWIDSSIHPHSATRADRQDPLPMFRCPGHARTTTARPGLP